MRIRHFVLRVAILDQIFHGIQVSFIGWRSGNNSVGSGIDRDIRITRKTVLW